MPARANPFCQVARQTPSAARQPRGQPDNQSDQQQQHQGAANSEAPGGPGCAGQGRKPKRRQQRRERQDQDDELHRVADQPEPRKAKAQPAIEQAAVAQGQNQAEAQQVRPGRAPASRAPAAPPLPPATPFRSRHSRTRSNTARVAGTGPALVGEVRNSGTRKLAQPQIGIAQSAEP